MNNVGMHLSTDGLLFKKVDHFSGLPIEVPEMNSTAKLIIERIRKLDYPQYEALMKSIGELEVTP